MFIYDLILLYKFARNCIYLWLGLFDNLPEIPVYLWLGLFDNLPEISIYLLIYLIILSTFSFIYDSIYLIIYPKSMHLHLDLFDNLSKIGYIYPKRHSESARVPPFRGACDLIRPCLSSRRPQAIFRVKDSVPKQHYRSCPHLSSWTGVRT